MAAAFNPQMLDVTRAGKQMRLADALAALDKEGETT
jgi:hypothetical protein